MSWLLDADVMSQPAKRRGDQRVIGSDRDFRRPGVKVLNPFKELT